ncbi:DUF896 domain-containing protein [Tissierella creatinophila]|uniref:UPF0291 protein TICRE_10200 n=1 Tax=Tissierella creatinophila DSM 6911 TaxID=1123403 RepID=A0A1U7M6L4_TISCR|nr:DUF896 domain-containing protein [Tissierella creatinophila]OLS02963.1 hypothetical protein TICRE_10200 [Tissierella creatinophila DSM 6911]
MKDLIKRINELANKAKLNELSPDEKIEQAELRKKYLDNFRGSFKETLMHVKVVDEEGRDVTPEKLIKEQQKRKN